MKRYQSNYMDDKSDQALLALDVQKTSDYLDASMEIGATTAGFFIKTKPICSKGATKDLQLLSSYNKAATEVFSTG